MFNIQLFGFLLVLISFILHIIFGSDDKQFKARVLISLFGLALMIPIIH